MLKYYLLAAAVALPLLWLLNQSKTEMPSAPKINAISKTEIVSKPAPLDDRPRGNVFVSKADSIKTHTDEEALVDALKSESVPAEDINPDRDQRKSDIAAAIEGSEFTEVGNLQSVSCDETSCTITVNSEVPEIEFLTAAVTFLKNHQAVGEKLTITTDSYAPRSVNVSTTSISQ